MNVEDDYAYSPAGVGDASGSSDASKAARGQDNLKRRSRSSSEASGLGQPPARSAAMAGDLRRGMP